MMKVYAVLVQWDEETGADDLVGIFDSEDAADNFIDRKLCHEECTVVEFELNKHRYCSC